MSAQIIAFPGARQDQSRNVPAEPVALSYEHREMQAAIDLYLLLSGRDQRKGTEPYKDPLLENTWSRPTYGQPWTAGTLRDGCLRVASLDPAGYRTHMLKCAMRSIERTLKRETRAEIAKLERKG